MGDLGKVVGKASENFLRGRASSEKVGFQGNALHEKLALGLARQKQAVSETFREWPCNRRPTSNYLCSGARKRSAFPPNAVTPSRVQKQPEFVCVPC